MLIYIIITLLILNLLIIVHEFGHFAVARKLGIRVEEFAIGMGPILLSHQTDQTLYSLRLIPIGGFCSLQEETKTETVDLLNGEYTEIQIKNPNFNEKESFINRPAYQRLLVLIAGVLMNFILAFLLTFLAFLLAGRSFNEAIIGSSRVFISFFGLVFMSIKMLLTGEAGVNDLTGPIGIVTIVGQYYQEGLIFLMLFTAMLSVNLGILNLLPIPALDGGQILLLVIEKIKKKEIGEQLKGSLFIASYIVLVGLALYVGYNDLLRFKI